MRREAILAMTAVTALVLGAATHSASQEDAPGSADHPLITRYAGWRIIDPMQVDFDEYEAPLGRATKTIGGTFGRPVCDKSQKLEGRMTIEGLWTESRAGGGSVCEVKQDGDKVTATYKSVNDMMADTWGYAAGDLCFEGTFDGVTVVGETEVHYPVKARDEWKCRNWSQRQPVTLTLSDDGKRLEGHYDDGDLYRDCRSVRRGPVLYTLTRKGDEEHAKEGGVCGPDITKVLKLMVTEVENVWRHTPDSIWDRDMTKNVNPKLRACLSIAPLRRLPYSLPRIESRAPNAWESQELRSVLQRHQDRFPKCSLGGPKGLCERSVTVDGKSYFAGSVNYAIFGVMWRLCGDLEGYVTGGWPAMEAYIRVYKWWTEATNTEASVDWAKATYDGWPYAQDVSSPPAESGWPSQCATTCGQEYLDPLHWWVQGLQPRGIRPPGDRPRNLNGYDGKGYRDNEPTPRFEELDGKED